MHLVVSIVSIALLCLATVVHCAPKSIDYNQVNEYINQLVEDSLDNDVDNPDINHDVKDLDEPDQADSMNKVDADYSDMQARRDPWWNPFKSIKKTFKSIKKTFKKAGCAVSLTECAYTADKGLIKNTWDGIRKDVKLSHYSLTNRIAATISFDANTNAFSCATCKSNLPFVLYSHGFDSRPDKKWAELYKDCNVILLNWNKLAKKYLLYDPSAKNAIDVGRYVGKMLVALSNELGVAGSRIHLIGHSLGAHLSGNAARTFTIERNGEQIGRLTALDPAGPRWVDGQKVRAIPELYDNRLRYTDAAFVDVVHTNADLSPCLFGCDPVALGDLHELGHADFYVGNVKNGKVALLQPGCSWSWRNPFDLKIGCSHGRAIKYYQATFADGHKYPGWKCSSLGNCLKGVVNKGEVNYMGEQAKKPAKRSLYYVEIDM